jgi:hypothetical protein
MTQISGDTEIYSYYKSSQRFSLTYIHRLVFSKNIVPDKRTVQSRKRGEHSLSSSWAAHLYLEYLMPVEAISLLKAVIKITPWKEMSVPNCPSSSVAD